MSVEQKHEWWKNENENKNKIERKILYYGMWDFILDKNIGL